MGDHHADEAATLAVEADTVRRRVWLSSVEKGADDLDELLLIDRAAAQLEIDANVIGDRRGSAQRLDVVGPRIDDRGELAHVLEIAQCLDAARGRARADGDEMLRGATDLMNALGIVRRRDRAFDERQVVWPAHHGARRLDEVRDFDLARDGQQLVFAIEQRELAAVARGELPHGQLRFAFRFHSSRMASQRATRS